jgi:hypothetical protein
VVVDWDKGAADAAFKGHQARAAQELADVEAYWEAQAAQAEAAERRRVVLAAAAAAAEARAEVAALTDGVTYTWDLAAPDAQLGEPGGPAAPRCVAALLRRCCRWQPTCRCGSLLCSAALVWRAPLRWAPQHWRRRRRRLRSVPAPCRRAAQGQAQRQQQAARAAAGLQSGPRRGAGPAGHRRALVAQLRAAAQARAGGAGAGGGRPGGQAQRQLRRAGAAYQAAQGAAAQRAAPADAAAGSAAGGGGGHRQHRCAPAPAPPPPRSSALLPCPALHALAQRLARPRPAPPPLDCLGPGLG